MTSIRLALRIFAALATAAAALLLTPGGHAGAAPVPAPKEIALSGDAVALTSVRIECAPELRDNEQPALEAILRRLSIRMDADGYPIRLAVGTAPVPELATRHRAAIARQAYRIDATTAGLTLTGGSPQGVYYALQTLDQMLTSASLPLGTVTDWPDLAVRMIMIDPARQNESLDYYSRVIEFAGRYKISAILCHLTDDQTSVLFHEDYPELMHEHAWTSSTIAQLHAIAAAHHVELIPEIESLGHSRMFERRADYRDFLHETESETPDQSWMGTQLPGYTNVLCPGSEKAVEYLDQMYARTATTFPHPILHIGFDEVDMTTCSKCANAFGVLSGDEWFAAALQQSAALAARHGRTAAAWGDMILARPAIADLLPSRDILIFDWYYRPDVTDESVKFFRERGFEVIASPALMCAPHMVLPNSRNYENIARFTRIAREHDLPGVNTTIWVPTRYMSDVLWTGIAFAAAHAWDGAAFDEAAFFDGFAHDYFGLEEGSAFGRAWARLAQVHWHRDEFNAGGWMDATSLAAARAMVEKRSPEIEAMLDEVRAVQEELAAISEDVARNRTEWMALEHAAAILAYTMERLLAAAEAPDSPNLLTSLDARCRKLIRIIETDWDRNRFADDPGKEGRFLQTQHLLFRFKQMHAYHQELLGVRSPAQP